MYNFNIPGQKFGIGEGLCLFDTKKGELFCRAHADK